MRAIDDQMIRTLALREATRDAYFEHRDPIADDRLHWRANSFRHLVHLLPGQTVLEIGCGAGRFTRELAQLAGGRCHVTAISFQPPGPRPALVPAAVEMLWAHATPAALDGRQFDVVVALDVLDRRNCAALLQFIYDHLAPGGQVVFYESNPWNVVLKIRRALARLAGHADPRALLNKSQLYELISQVGFIRVFAAFNDFVYAPLSRRLIWLLRNLSIVLENMPAAQTLAGSILLYAQKPPHTTPRPQVSLTEHASLHGAVSVVVPCHNEEMNVGPLVDGLRRHFDAYVKEIILVDDNSRDHTARVIRELAARDPRVRLVSRNPPNGVGRALADGYRAATGQYVLTMDCDFQQLLPEFEDLFDAIAAGCDVAVGSRFSRHSVLLNYPFTKIVANRGFHAIGQILLWRSFRDLTNNLKVLRREVVDDLCLLEPWFAANAETGLQPALLGYDVKEVPMSWINRAPDMGVSSFTLAGVGWGYWRVLARLWLWRVFDRGPYRALSGRGPKRVSAGA